MKPASTAKPRPKPMKVKVGAVSLPIYRLKDNRWCLIYPGADGKRVRLTKVSLAEIRKEAVSQCLAIANGQSIAELSVDERLQAAAALDALEGTGVPLDGVAREYMEARKITGGASIAEMARFFARHHAAGASSRAPAEILAEMLEAKTRQGLDRHGITNMRLTLQKFVARFPGPIGEISATEIRRYVEGLPISPRSRNNVRRDLVTLFGFARDARDLPEDKKTEAQKVGKAKEPRKAPAIFTPQELSEWLGAARPEWLPFVALGAFAGIRSFEITRMDWSDILWLQQEIHLRPEVTKTGEGRYVPLQPNLAQWLLPHRQGAGWICPREGSFDKEIEMMSKRLKRPWKQNALRHSYGSYRLAILRDLGLLTVEMGNSVAVNRRNYQNPRSRQSAQEWFSLVPAKGGKIIPMGGA